MASHEGPKQGEPKTPAFLAETWKPPDKETRKIRREFYAPITNAMLEKALAGEPETPRGEETAEQKKAKTKARSRWKVGKELLVTSKVEKPQVSYFPTASKLAGRELKSSLAGHLLQFVAGLS